MSHHHNSYWFHRLAAAALLLALLSIAIAPASQASADSPEPEPEIPPIPLYLAIDNFGTLTLTTGEKDQPRWVTRIIAPTSFPVMATLGQNLLIVRFDGYDQIFDLGKRPLGVITFDRGYYKATRLSAYRNALVIEAARTFLRNDAPIAQLQNPTAIKVKEGRRSCLETAFHSRMEGVVLNAVRLRRQPFIPMELDENWKGSLRTREKVYILLTYCNAGSWLRVQDEAGNIGWAKEWGLTEKLVEVTYIAPDTVKK
jgi:hypothetical protein